MSYIEREALIAEIQEELDFESMMYSQEQNKYINLGLKIAQRDIKKRPTADVAPIVHGYWKDNGRCSCCEAFSVSHGADYCPNCGAKMDGERREK